MRTTGRFKIWLILTTLQLLGGVQAHAGWVDLKDTLVSPALANDLHLPTALESTAQKFLIKELDSVADPKFASRIILQTDEEGRFIEGRPVTIMMHGFFSWPGYYELLQAEILKKGHHVLNIRLPGHFDKTYAALDKVVAEDFLNLADEAFELARLLKGPIHMVGHSAGGFLVTDLARRHSDEVKSLLLFAPALQIGRHILSFTAYASAFNLSWKDLIFWHKDAAQIYRSTMAANELNRLCRVSGFPRWHRQQEEWVKPLRKIKILMFNTHLETVILLQANYRFAKVMGESENFEHVVFPIKRKILHDKLGKLPPEKNAKSWEKIRNFLTDAEAPASLHQQ